MRLFWLWIGSEEILEVEISDIELEALRKIGNKKITRDAVVSAIENGNKALEPLHNKLEDGFYYMVEEYWLYEADNEYMGDSLAEAMEQDISEGVYVPPISLEQFVNEVKAGEIDFDELQFGYFDDIDEDYDFEDEEDLEFKYDNYILNKYYEWVCEHDHEFVAPRVGLDLDACRDDEPEYTILFNFN